MFNRIQDGLRKKLFIIALSFCAVANLSAQTQIKANAAYWLFGVVNIGAETSIGDNFTLNGDVVYSPWKSVNGNKFQICQIVPEVRFYPKGSFEKFYVGAYAGWHFFKMTKWNYINKGYYQDGNGYSVGAVIGFQTAISDRWRVDTYVGGGYQNSGYRGYVTKTGEMYVGWNRSGEWIPYKIGIAFAYRICN